MTGGSASKWVPNDSMEAIGTLWDKNNFLVIHGGFLEGG